MHALSLILIIANVLLANNIFLLLILINWPFFFFCRYGLPFISEDNLLVSTINGAGSAIELVYVIIFLIFAPRKEKAKIFGLLVSILTVFATVALVSLLALHGNARKNFCGFAATIFSVIMYASPLSVIVSKINLLVNIGRLWFSLLIDDQLMEYLQRMVIKTKSVEFMPFFLSLFVFLCGTSFFVYGLVGKDPFVAVSNLDLYLLNKTIYQVVSISL